MEGAGMGKLVTLKDKLTIEEIVKMIKKHLGLQYGQALFSLHPLSHLAILHRTTSVRLMQREANPQCN